MKNTKKCSKCNNEMEKGIARPEGGYVGRVIMWGKKVGWWTGSMENGKVVDTFRCKSCGYLESYAIDIPE